MRSEMRRNSLCRRDSSVGMSLTSQMKQRARLTFGWTVLFFSLWGCGGGGGGDGGGGPTGPTGPSPTPPSGSRLPLTVDPVSTPTNQIEQTLTGKTEAGAGVLVTGGEAPVTATADAGGRFSVTVRLARNAVNTLTVLALAAGGRQSAPLTVTIVHDDIPPPPPILDPPPSWTGNNPFTVTGATLERGTVTVTGPASSASLRIDQAGPFSLAIRLEVNLDNLLQATLTDVAGNTSPPDSILVRHDGSPPSLEIRSPTPTSFDLNGDLRVDVSLVSSDERSGVDRSSLSVMNDRPLGGGVAKGGRDAGTELIDLFTISEEEGNTGQSARLTAVLNAPLELEFPGGSNTLSVTAGDSVGNNQSAQVTFTVEGAQPSVDFLSPASGDVTPSSSGFTVEVGFTDLGGFPDPNTFTLLSSGTVGGVFRRDGSTSVVFDANADLSDLFEGVSEAGVTFTVPDSAVFEAGEITLKALISDRVENRSDTASVTFTVSPAPDRLILVDLAASPGGAGVPLLVGLANEGEEVTGVQFDLVLSDAVASVDSIRAVERAADLNSLSFALIGGGRVRVILFDTSGHTIAPGHGPILRAFLSIADGAATGSSTLTLIEGRVSDTSGQSKETGDAEATLTIQ